MTEDEVRLAQDYNARESDLCELSDWRDIQYTSDEDDEDDQLYYCFPHCPSDQTVSSLVAHD